MGSRWLVLPVAAFMAATACSRRSGENEPWREVNSRLEKEHNIKMRSRSIPETGVPLRVEAGKVQPLSALQKVVLAPGVTATLVWSKGALLEALEMEKGATYPSQQLNEEVITVVREGSGACELGGTELQLAPDSVLYLTAGTTRTLKAGPGGLKALEVFSPVRVDLLKLAGVTLPDGAKVGFPDQGVKPSLVAGQVYRLSEIQLTPVTDPDASLSYQRSAANSRLIWGRNVMLSFVRMDPNSSFPIHNHPEHQLMTVLRGSLTQGVMDSPVSMTEKEHSTLLLPGGMVHSARMSELGGDALDIFWPVRPDYVERAEKQNALYRQVVAPDAKPVKVADGSRFTEGPTWLKGKLDKIGGKPIDSHDSVVMDSKGGVYVADPRGKQVYYIAADGTAKVVIPAGEYAMPNGVEISPDGKTLYVDNAWLQPGENFLYAYDVHSDGSLAAKRKFAMLHLTDAVLSAPDPVNRFDSRAGGMAVDADGRIYVATLMGVQIFDKSGVYVGSIWCPQYPVRVTFGGKNGDILYMAGEKEVWSIQTQVKGFRLPAGMD